VRRLPAALAAARAGGEAGARFPWESAADGFDVTPAFGVDRTGHTVPILSGLAVHIVADVAWAAACYSDWTGDDDFANGPGRTLLFETARFWAARIQLDPSGSGHLLGVTGPDEYHPRVDDNAYTNVMARWNLRRAAAAARADLPGVADEEVERWEQLAAALVDGYDPGRRVYEQFTGFSELAPVVIAQVAPRRPITADVWLGTDVVRASQVLKQADVLMLHHLVPDEVVPGSLEPNLAFYEPRTAHGSSLSPGIHAALLARARRVPKALEALRLTSRIDLDDLTGTTAGGLHLAAMGSLWQSLTQGFGGIRPAGAVLEVDPVLPLGWRSFEIPVVFRGARVSVRIDERMLTIRSDRRIDVSVGGAPPTRVGAGAVHLPRPSSPSNHRRHV
jgi:trehalose/maltose hydrolase-like predicted phosphorylase